MEEMQGGWGLECPCPFQVCGPPSASLCPSTRKLSNPHHFVFFWRPHYKATIDEVLGHWINSTTGITPLPRGHGVGLNGPAL